MEPVVDVNRKLKISFYSHHPVYYKDTNIISILYQKFSISDIVTYKFALLPELGDSLDIIKGTDQILGILSTPYTEININITFNQKLYDLLFDVLHGMTPATNNTEIYVNSTKVELISMNEARYNMRTEEKKLEITKVIFHDPATIVFWNDKTKTIVKCQDGDPYDKEKGLAICISKKFFGNDGNYYNTFDKWLNLKDKKK